MRRPDFLALYRCKTPYNQEEILTDTIAWIRQEGLEPLAKQFCEKVAKHDRIDELQGQQIEQFDELIRPLLVASHKQRKLLMQKGLEQDEK